MGKRKKRRFWFPAYNLQLTTYSCFLATACLAIVQRKRTEAEVHREKHGVVVFLKSKKLQYILLFLKINIR